MKPDDVRQQHVAGAPGLLRKLASAREGELDVVRSRLLAVYLRQINSKVNPGESAGWPCGLPKRVQVEPILMSHGAWRVQALQADSSKGAARVNLLKVNSNKQCGPLEFT